MDLQCHQQYIFHKYGSLTQKSNPDHSDLEKEILDPIVDHDLPASPLNSVDSGYGGTYIKAKKVNIHTLTFLLLEKELWIERLNLVNL